MNIPDAVHDLIAHEAAVAYAQGRADERAVADGEIMAALRSALGGPGAATWAEAVHGHERMVSQTQRRQRAGAPDLVAEEAAQRAANAAAQRKRDAELIEAALRRGPAYTTWRQVHADVTPGVWARIWDDLAPATRNSLTDLDPSRPSRPLRRAA